MTEFCFSGEGWRCLIVSQSCLRVRIKPRGAWNQPASHNQCQPTHSTHSTISSLASESSTYRTTTVWHWSVESGCL